MSFMPLWSGCGRVSHGSEQTDKWNDHSHLDPLLLQDPIDDCTDEFVLMSTVTSEIRKCPFNPCLRASHKRACIDSRSSYTGGTARSEQASRRVRHGRTTHTPLGAAGNLPRIPIMEGCCPICEGQVHPRINLVPSRPAL